MKVGAEEVEDEGEAGLENNSLKCMQKKKQWLNGACGAHSLLLCFASMEIVIWCDDDSIEYGSLFTVTHRLSFGHRLYVRFTDYALCSQC